MLPRFERVSVEILVATEAKQKFQEGPSEALFHPDERTYASLLCRELDRFLFADADVGCVIHRSALRGEKQNYPDGYVVQLDESKPSRPWLVYSFKMNCMDTAEVESLGYC